MARASTPHACSTPRHGAPRRSRKTPAIRARAAARAHATQTQTVAPTGTASRHPAPARHPKNNASATTTARADNNRSPRRSPAPPTRAVRSPPAPHSLQAPCQVSTRPLAPAFHQASLWAATMIRHRAAQTTPQPPKPQQRVRAASTSFDQIASTNPKGGLHPLAAEDQPNYIRNTPKFVRGIGAFNVALNASASTRRVSFGAMMPSSQSRAVAK